jgi:hypothetical protein
MMATGHVGTIRIPDPTAMTRVLKLADAVLTYGVLRYADYCGYGSQLVAMFAAARDRVAAVIPRTKTMHEETEAEVP